MNRNIDFHLNKVNPIPHSLRFNPAIDAPAMTTEINLGQLFLHKYFDSFPVGAPDPDPSSFEYLRHISPAADFRFNAYVASASKTERIALSTSIGQAFCRLMLSDHFGIVHFAHMSEVLGKAAHSAFGGMRVERVCKGDVPDYLCGDDRNPFLAEAKGRFSAIKFENATFNDWREQFKRVRVVDSQDIPRTTKGYIVATKLVTDASPATQRAATFVEDPDTEGEPLTREQSLLLARGAKAIHYSRIFQKLQLTPFASALSLGYALKPGYPHSAQWRASWGDSAAATRPLSQKKPEERGDAEAARASSQQRQFRENMARLLMLGMLFGAMDGGGESSSGSGACTAGYWQNAGGPGQTWVCTAHGK